MRTRSTLAWLAVLPILVACGADAEPVPGDDAPSYPGKKAAAPGETGGDESGPSASGPETPAGPAGNACIAQPSCNGTAAPALGPKRAWIHGIQTPIVVATGPAFHRGRDQIYSVGEPQWVLGKFTYNYADTDLDDEEVDVFLDRGCGGAWEKLGTTKTTTNGSHATVEGIADDGGRVYFQIPKDKELAPGRHRIRLVVAGDQTSTDLVIDVVPKGTPIAVSDVDGTLTATETAEYPALLSGALPEPQPKAADMLATLSGKGYRIVYLTARPEWLTFRTKEFLTKNGFPPGIVHTTTGLTGALGGAASTFKSSELAMLAAHGLKIDWAFGNQPSDTDAYDAAKIQPLDRRVFLRQADPHGGRRIEAYSEILPVVSALPSLCK